MVKYKNATRPFKKLQSRSQSQRSNATTTTRAVQSSSTPQHLGSGDVHVTAVNPELDMDLSERMYPPDDQPDIRIAIDFGTTYTSIACCTIQNGIESEIFTIGRFRGDPKPSEKDVQVPTEIAYIEQPLEEQNPEDDPFDVIFGHEMKMRSDHGFDPHKGIIHVKNIKLHLDASEHLTGLKRQLRTVMAKFQAYHVDKDPSDVLYDLLLCYLNHTKNVLEHENGLHEESKVEITFCVPVCWTPLANTIMSACVQKAMRAAHLGVGRLGRCNVFMVNEAEGQANNAMCSGFFHLKVGEVFLLLDCGGGTTDAGVYKVGHENPFRLGEEVIPVTGIVCGSGDLNDEFRKFAVKELRHADYDGEESVDELVDRYIMPQFEDTEKPRFSSREGYKQKTYTFRVRGIHEHSTRWRIKNQGLVLSFKDMEDIFMPSLKTIGELMEAQIHKVFENGGHIHRVILVGGFGDSPALRDHLHSMLKQINQENNLNIMWSPAPANTGRTGLAKGALLRAREKAHGPARKPCQSIGIPHHIPINTKEYPEDVLRQSGATIRWGLDGHQYIWDTIKWVIKINQGEVGAVHIAEWTHSHQTDSGDETDWVVSYDLYASDECTEDYYTISHPKNNGKVQSIGYVTFDLFPIKQYLRAKNVYGRSKGTPRYAADIRHEMRIIGKHLTFRAYFPSEGKPEEVIEGTHDPINITSSFRAGTA